LNVSIFNEILAVWRVSRYFLQVPFWIYHANGGRARIFL